MSVRSSPSPAAGSSGPELLDPSPGFALGPGSESPGENTINHTFMCLSTLKPYRTPNRRRLQLLVININSHSWLFPGISYISPPSVSSHRLSFSRPLPAHPPVGLTGKNIQGFTLVVICYISVPVVSASSNLKMSTEKMEVDRLQLRLTR